MILLIKKTNLLFKNGLKMMNNKKFHFNENKGSTKNKVYKIDFLKKIINV